MITVSIIVPAYNEEKTIIPLLNQVAGQTIEGVKFEVIVVDDGSSDGTLDLLNKAPDLYTKLIVLKKNGGKGKAVQAGIRAASGQYILFQDADLEYNPAEYSALLFPVKEFEACVVIGSRFLSPRYTRVSYFWHKVGNRLITFIFNLLNNTTFTDIYSCYLLYKRELVDPESLTTFGWEQHAEILSKAVRNGSIFYEIPISYHGRSYGEGKKIRGYHIIAVLWTIIVKRIMPRRSLKRRASPEISTRY